MTLSIPQVILEGLTNNEEFARKCFPFLKEQYFSDTVDREIFKISKTFFEIYNKLPTREILAIEINSSRLPEKTHKSALDTVSEFRETIKEESWLIETTEKFCRDRAIHIAIVKSIEIMDGQDTKLHPDAIPALLEDALSVSFDNSIGHDYFNDAEDRYDVRHLKEEKIAFDISILNKITRGGLSKKTLNVLMAGIGAGKSQFMCHYATSCLKQGKNVLYITMEMSQEAIAERIDANLLDIPLEDFGKLSKEVFVGKVQSIQRKLHGELVIKEYPTGSAHAGHFKALLTELKQKKKFTPDIIFVDYINICCSQRYGGGNVNSYTIVKSIAEELRGLAVSENAVLFSATQYSRCLSSDTLIQTKDGIIPIKDIKIGMEVLGDQGYNVVEQKYESEEEVYEIALESGKRLQCSPRHLFPTRNKLKSLDLGLSVGDCLVSISSIEKIFSIKKIGARSCVDIELSGNKLFYANDILTHNSGLTSTDVEMSDVSESIGLPATVDFMLALIATEEFESLNQVMAKQLKNRYNDLNFYKRFMLGVDRSKMRFYDTESDAQTNITNSGIPPEDLKPKKSKASTLKF